MPNDSEDYILGAVSMPGLVKRTPVPTSTDFTQEVLTLDSASHELDLSSIVPAGAVAVLLRAKAYSSSAWSFLFSDKGDSLTQTQTALNPDDKADYNSDMICLIFCDSGRIIEYRGQAVIVAVQITVIGWFI